MVVLGASFTVLAFVFIGVTAMAAANNHKTDAQIMALEAIACAILGIGFLNVS